MVTAFELEMSFARPYTEDGDMTSIQCPHCWSRNIYATDNGYDGRWLRHWIVCEDCGATTNDHSKLREAFREWEDC